MAVEYFVWMCLLAAICAKCVPEYTKEQRDKRDKHETHIDCHGSICSYDGCNWGCCDRKGVCTTTLASCGPPTVMLKQWDDTWTELSLEKRE